MTRLLAAMLVALCTATGPAAAQQPFAAAATVNGMVVTNYAVDQRAQFLSLLRAPDTDRASVTDTLIDETLQVEAARLAGIEVTEEELAEGMTEFAGRADLSAEAFTAELERAGVAAETFQDFVRSGLYWRRLVQARFGERARPEDREVRRIVDRGPEGEIRVLLSEIALPFTPENRAEVEALAERLSGTLRGQAAFEDAARTYSRASSARTGGRVDWLALAGLAPPIAGEVLTLAPGEVTEPINLGNFIGLFLLRDLDDQAGAATVERIDYAEYLIPGGRSVAALQAAAALDARVDVCDDLYGEARGRPEGTLTRQDAAPDALPADLRQELAKLDPGEVSTLLTRGDYLRVVMLCERQVATSEDAFERVGQQILNQRLTGLADGYLAELRADAVVTR
ncbi:peptidylprolyl isomerase [uncultured Jannaschia sp.]|uniref:peptidylprolyl isomerase n=1 Tax=uncultured Jannaschia sp. TaxID=293347 RepID=UPI002606C598|nr:peptidylprolyl isomerase [uncultured Jannaschia sp.]